MQEITARIRLGSFTSNGTPEGGGWSLEIRDEASGHLIVDAELTYREFGQMMTNREIELSAKILNDTRFMGAEWVTKDESIVVTTNGEYPETDAVLAEIKAREVDGWHRIQEAGDDGFRLNAHHVSKGAYGVKFGRYLDPATGEPIAPRSGE